jgi:redox-sensitive bicupin YhaK (pirin superfamily)
MNTNSQATVSVTPNATATSRSVAAVYGSTDFHWVGNGFYVSTYFPRRGLPAEKTSPFVLMDYGPPRDFEPRSAGKRGVGWHPHRGFETVTLAWEGAVAHRDNAGHAGVIRPGDTQWMTAGAGIFHEEYHEEELTRAGGRMHMMQLWVNLPKKAKMSPPGYQNIAASSVPRVDIPGGGGSLRVLAGELFGAKGPARTFTPITILDVDLEPGGRLVAPLAASYNVLAIVASGAVAVGGKAAKTGELVLFAKDGAQIEVVAEEATHLLVLAGEPIDEPVVQYGPFVMNTIDEIETAIADLQRGKFGPVPD